MCMTFVVGRKVSATGRVLIGHNEDDEGHTVVRHGYVPAADWPEGTLIPAEDGLAKIPQASHTFGYHWSELAGPDGGYPWGDAFFNECGVVVTSNNCGFSKEDQPDLTDGGMAYNLRRVLAERSGSAREGLMVMIDMVETWGYAPSGRCYFVADKDEAFLMQIVSGKHWMAVRVPDDHVVVMPNHYTLRWLDEYEETYCSPDLVDYAFERGWYDPMRDGRFEFAKIFQGEKTWRKPVNTLRHQYSLGKLLGRKWDAEKEGYPCSVKYDGKVTVKQIMDLLSNHFEGTEHDVRIGPGRAPHDAEICRVCGADTSESFVVDFHENPKLTTMWTAFGRPCELPYLPLHPLSDLPQRLKTIPDPAQAMEDHLKPNPRLTDHTDDVWQRFHDFSNAMELAYSQTAERVKIYKDSMFRMMNAENEEMLRSQENVYNPGQLQKWEEAWLERMDIGYRHLPLNRKFDAEYDGTVHRGDTLRVVIRPGVVPEFSSLRLGVCRSRDHGQYAQATKLTDFGKGKYAVEFPVDPLFKWTAMGRHESFLGGADKDGNAFVYPLMLNFCEDGEAWKFELNNAQRACFGLRPVEDGWTRITLKPSPYDDFDMIAYLDGNVIRKCILIGEERYSETEYCEELSEDLGCLLPKTAKGKPVKLSSSTMLKRKPVGMALSWSRGYICLSNQNSGCDYYSGAYERKEVNTFRDFRAWVETWCAETTAEDLADIEAFAQRTKRHVKYREGDVFRYKIGRREYGYGRILVDYVQMRRKKQPFWDILMGTPLVCSAYHILTGRKDVTADELMNLKSLPSCIVADNNLYYGQWEIIGNIPVGENEDYPIMCGGSIDMRDNGEGRVLLQCGKRFMQLENQKSVEHGFTNNSVGFSMNVVRDVLERCIAEGSNEPYWAHSYAMHVTDLRNPRFRKSLEAVCGQFGLAPEDLIPKDSVR